MKSLINIVNDCALIEKALIESGGEITPEIELMMAIKDIQLPEKVDSYAAIMERFDNVSEFYNMKAKAFFKMYQATAKISEGCSDRIKFAMVEMKLTELHGHDVRFKLSDTAGAVEIVNETLIPSEYKTIVQNTVTDKKRIAEDLKLGIPVNGCELKINKSLRKYLNKSK